MILCGRSLTNKLNWYWDSIFRSTALMAGCDIESCSAAAETDPCSTTATKYESCLNELLMHLPMFQYNINLY